MIKPNWQSANDLKKLKIFFIADNVHLSKGLKIWQC